MKALRTLAALLFAALCINACDRTPTSVKTPNMTALSPRLQPLFEKTKTVCFGRLVMEVPATATVVFGPASVPAKIERLQGEADKLASWVERREKELQAEGRKPTGSGLTLHKETLDGALPDQKIVIGWRSFSDPFYKVESFIKMGPDLYIQEAEASPKNEELHREAGMTMEQVIAGLNSSARSLRPRADAEVPSDPGVCIDGAFISGQLDQSVEIIALGVRLKEFPDVHFSIETRKTQRPPLDPVDVDMERRLKDAERDASRSGQGAWYSSVKFFRRGERELSGGWKGYEVLARKPAQGKVKENHQFVYASSGELKNPFKPSLDIQLNTGVDDNQTGAVPASLTDEEAIAVWDKITSSIRVRPTGGGTKTSDATPPKTPLGELASTGRACPQTGWWECTEEARPVQGGRRQFLRGGERMPHAILQGEPSVWQKLKGDVPMHRVATVWQLVDYEAPPAVALPAPADAQSQTPHDPAAPDERKGEGDGASPSSKA